MGKAAGVKRRKRKKFRFNVCRKKLGQKERHQKFIECDAIRKAWDPKQTVAKNMERIGLAYDPNTIKSLAVTTTQETLEPKTNVKKRKTFPIVETEVTAKLEESVKNSMVGAKTFRFSKDQVKWITYLLDTYGEDYKQMTKDPKNLFQETANQLKRKVALFKSIPEHFAPYLKQRGLLLNE